MKPVWDEKEKNSKQFKEAIIEAGVYEGKIKKVEWIESEYSVTQYNPKGTCLSVWVDILLDEGGTKRVFDKISITNPTKLNDLRTAAGLKPVKKGEDFDEKPLEGKLITIEVDEYKSKAGKVSNIAKAYLAESNPEFEQENDGKEVPF